MQVINSHKHRVYAIIVIIVNYIYILIYVKPSDEAKDEKCPRIYLNKLALIDCQR